jgi:hypothetical protein
MTESSDVYWDELGVTWRAIDPDVTVIASRLEARLRRQSRWITAGLAIGLPLGAVGVLLGVRTIVIGLASGGWNFLTRGIAIVAMSALLTFAMWSLQSAGARSAAHGTLSERIDLAIRRAQATFSLIKAGQYSCVIAAVFGLVGTVIRTHLGNPPKMSPIIDLVALALIALALFQAGGQVRARLVKYCALKQALAPDAGQ